jgi:ABC-type bacteriocin/lantibiotic exporter with double-glycine peptidase domain
MEITYQNSENECGVCVINSFYKYFYKKNIKNKILDCANITKNGINLFDFETLCDKFGMFAECFYTTHKELEELNHSGYFCLLINDFCPHYIICKKRRNTLEVLDSAKGKYVIKINELPKNSSLVFIKVNKNKNYINEKINLRKKNIFKTLNFNYLIVSLMLKLFFVTTAIFGSKYISLILDDSISNNSINNLITLTIFFAIIFSLNILSKYLINLFTSKSLMQNFNFYASEFINCIEKKDETFFNKINKNQIFLIDYSILSISKFFSFEITNLFTNIMCAIVCLCLIMIINKILLFVIAVSIVINSIIFIYDYKKKSSILNKTINNTLCIDTCISD